MQRYSLVILFALVVSSCSNELDRDSYDRSCLIDDDCFIQSYKLDECGVFALNRNETERVSRDFGALGRSNLNCDLADVTARCQNQECTIAPTPTCDPNAEVDTCENERVCTLDGLCTRIE